MIIQNPVRIPSIRPIAKIGKKGCNRKRSEQIDRGCVLTEKRRRLDLNSTEKTEAGENLFTINDDCIVLYHYPSKNCQIR